MTSNGAPAVVSREMMAAILQDMADRVRTGDCWEGAIEFHYWDDFFGAGENEYSAKGAYRIGNLEGQGGMRIIEAGPAIDVYPNKEPKN